MTRAPYPCPPRRGLVPLATYTPWRIYISALNDNDVQAMFHEYIGDLTTLPL